MTLTKISDKINQTYKIGTLVVDRYNGYGIINGYKYCKNYGGELPIVRFAGSIIKFSHPECLSIVGQTHLEIEFREKVQVGEPPDPDDYLGQSLPLAEQTLQGIRRLDWECHRYPSKLTFCSPTCFIQSQQTHC